MALSFGAAFFFFPFSFVSSPNTFIGPEVSPASWIASPRTQRHGVWLVPSPVCAKKASAESSPATSVTSTAKRVTIVCCLTCEKTCVTSPICSMGRKLTSVPALLTRWSTPNGLPCETGSQNETRFSAIFARSKSFFVSAGATTDGNSHSPPNKPPSGRFVTKYPMSISVSVLLWLVPPDCLPIPAPAAKTTRASTTRVKTVSNRFSAFLSFSGKSVTLKGLLLGSPVSSLLVTSALPLGSVDSLFNVSFNSSSSDVSILNPWQYARSGQVKHFGFRGVHTVAPSSIIAWLKSPGRVSSNKAFAISRTALLALVLFFTASPPPTTEPNRVATLITLPSTAAIGS
mmetsp:Transcript_4233/g.14104  ORF Transcript_4233/g.14104 Transcript_4233/m.14104 type:complete len:344 (-) Transcript_4233:211-1242(-)